MRCLKFIIAISISLCSMVVNAQLIEDEKDLILEVSDFSSLHNDQPYVPEIFNYQDYEAVNLEDFNRSFKLDDVKKYTFFAVFSHSGTNALFEITSDNRMVKISNNVVEGRQKIDIRADENFSHIVLYSGSNGKKTNDDISAKLNIGSSDLNRQDGIINVAEVLVFEKVLSRNEMNKHQSRLAIKYGISLPADSSYYNQQGEVIYDPNNHFKFNNRVVALANDVNLNTSQVVHHRDHFFKLGVGQISDMQINNPNFLRIGSYMFIGDNSGTKTFIDNSLDRQWKVVTNPKSIESKTFSFQFIKNEILNYDDSFDYFLSISPEDKNIPDASELLKLREVGDHLIIDNVLLAHASEQYLSLVRRPKKPLIQDDIVLQVNNLQLEGRQIDVSLISNNKHLEGELILHNLLGYQISKSRINSGLGNKQQFRFNFPGIYFVSFVSGNIQTTRKVIIQ